MSKNDDFTRGLRQESQHPMPASKTDLWQESLGIDSVVQRQLTGPLADGAAAREIKVSAVRPDPNQPRKTMDPQRLDELVDSIRENGVLQPITVTWSAGERCYLIVTGQRRYEAAKRAGIASIPAIIRPGTYDESERVQQQLVENIQREGLPPIDEARAVRALMETFSLSQRAVARRLGKSQTYVAELLQILRIPEELLRQATSLPKHALIQASRAKSAAEQQRLIDSGLASGAPFTQIMTDRIDKRPQTRYAQFKKTFQADGTPGELTVSLPKPTDEVTREEVIEFITKVVETLITDPGH